MSNLHIYFETGAIGDTCFNLCRANIAMEHEGHDATIVHTSPIFKTNGYEIKTNPNVAKILSKCNFIKSVEYDIDYNIKESFSYSKKYQKNIKQPMFTRENNDLKSWIDLTEFLPPCEEKEKVAVFQPISLIQKPKQYLNDYIPVWDRCIRLLHEKKYKIYMVGAENDPIDLCIKPETQKLTINMLGKWSLLQSLSFTMYKADLIVSCDSWAAIWGPASKIQTFTAWGYRMENNIDTWALGFLGNRQYYKFGWSSQKEYCDAYLAGCLSDYLAGPKNEV